MISKITIPKSNVPGMNFREGSTCEKCKTCKDCLCSGRVCTRR